MGVNVNAQDLDSFYYNALQNVLNILMKRAFRPLYYPEITFRLTQDYEHFRKNKDIVWGLTTKVIECGDVNQNAYRNLLDYLIALRKDKPNFTDEDLLVETNMVVVGANETSANAICYVLLNLAANKDIQNKVCEELFEVLRNSNEGMLEFEDLSKLKYMEMVIKESMRLYSTVPFIGREVSEDIYFENYIIPKGVQLWIPIFSLHRNKDYWENPLKFDPERFRTDNIEKRHPFTYIPFSSGPRNCIGKRYAWIFLKITLATLLSRFEFHTDLNLDELKFEFEISLKLIGGHQVRITPRNR